jgi:hypothetical protein
VCAFIVPRYHNYCEWAFRFIVAKLSFQAASIEGKKRMLSRSLLVLAGTAVTALFTLVETARAAVVLGDPWDQVIASDGSLIDVSVGPLGASTFEPGPGSHSALYVFQLPAPPKGQLAIVASAQFQFTIVDDLPNGTYNIDLYGLRARRDPDVFETDNYYGPHDPSSSTVMIQDNILLANNTSTGPVDTDAAAGGRLAAYLNAQYGPGGAGAGSYVFLRLNPDLTPPTNEDTGVDVSFADNDTGLPQLTIDFVPEPNCLGFFAGAGMCLGRRRAGRRSKF